MLSLRLLETGWRWSILCKAWTVSFLRSFLDDSVRLNSCRESYLFFLRYLTFAHFSDYQILQKTQGEEISISFQYSHELINHEEG